MKKSWIRWMYFVIGVIMSVVGMGFADIIRKVYGLTYDYGDAYILGYGIYLCIVMITCTGIIVSKIESLKSDE